MNDVKETPPTRDELNSLFSAEDEAADNQKLPKGQRGKRFVSQYNIKKGGEPDPLEFPPGEAPELGFDAFHFSSPPMPTIFSAAQTPAKPIEEYVLPLTPAQERKKAKKREELEKWNKQSKG